MTDQPFPFRGEPLPKNAFWFRSGSDGWDFTALQLKSDGSFDKNKADVSNPVENEDRVCYGMPVYALADGEVYSSWRNAPERPGESHSGRSSDPKTIPRSGNPASLFDLWGIKMNRMAYIVLISQVLLTMFTGRIYAQDGQSTGDFFLEEPPAPPTFDLHWRGLENGDSAVEVRSEPLYLIATNISTSPLKLWLTIETSTDGTHRPSSLRTRSIEPGDELVLPVRLDELGVELGNLKFAGRIDATFQARSPAGHVVGEGLARELYFHPSDNGTVWVYRTGAYLNRFGRGNFRQVPLPRLTDTLAEGNRLLKTKGLYGLQFQLKEVAAPNPRRTRPDDTVQAPPRALHGGVNTVRFCLMMKSEAYRDASPQENGFDYGEDFGRDLLNLSRIFMRVDDSQGTIFVGHTNEFGCTPWLETNDDAGLTISYVPWYERDDVSMWVVDEDIGFQIPTYVIENVDFINNATNILWANKNEPPLTIYGAAAAGVERFRADYPGGEGYEFTAGMPPGVLDGTATDYNGTGNPRVKIAIDGKFTWRSKFTIVHEYGHAVLMTKLAPPINGNTLDYTVTGMGDGSHTMRSLEWELTAAIEGFAHFVSAAVWNSTEDNANGVYVNGSSLDESLNTIFQLGEAGRYFEKEICEEECPASQSVPLDWAQFFWNYYTDIHPTGHPRPTTADLVKEWFLSYPWPKHEGFMFDRLSALVSANEELPNWSYVRFDDLAYQFGLLGLPH